MNLILLEWFRVKCCCVIARSFLGEMLYIDGENLVKKSEG